MSLLIPILSFFQLFDIFSEIQNFFNEMQKNIDEFKWEKNEPLEKKMKSVHNILRCKLFKFHI